MPDPISLTPIGIIHTPFTDRYRAPRQPGAAPESAEGTIELFPGHNFEAALEDLAGFDLIWVIYWFHRNTHWRPKVLPPRGGRTRRSVFATRSPHRPNALGLSLLKLVSVRGRTLRVADVDLLDQTPVLDIKPYLPYAEARPDARMGWLDALERSGDPDAERYTVSWSEFALEQRELLLAHGVDLDAVALPQLRRDPHPHPYRRIQKRADGVHQIAVTSWRVRYTVVDDTVRVDHIASGYGPEALVAEAALLDESAHRAFHARWPTIAARLADATGA